MKHWYVTLPLTVLAGFVVASAFILCRPSGVRDAHADAVWMYSSFAFYWGVLLGRRQEKP